VHLREDRRHIQDRDVRLLRETVRTKLNLEMANAAEIVEIALEVAPHDVCLVPEKREEVTTEGGLDVAGQREPLATTVARLSEAGIVVSMFVDPEVEQLRACAEIGAPFVELHTGRYAEAKSEAERQIALDELESGFRAARDLGLRVNAGHGLNYENIGPFVRRLPALEELNIGHAIVAQAVFVGLPEAVRQMKALMRRGGES
jgi:pyridoxine 5-phosphate synthase